MARLARTEGLTDVQEEILRAVRDFVDGEIIPSAQELEHADEYPQAIVDGMKDMGIFGLTIPEEYGGLGESLLTYALCVEQLVARLDERERHRQHALHRRVHAHAARHRRAEAALPAADGDRRGARRLLDERARLRVRRRGDHLQGGAGRAAGRRRRRVGARRAEDVAHQRRDVDAGRGARAHRRRRGPGRGVGLPQDVDVPAGQAGRLRRGRARADHPRQDRQDGLQGRRHDRARDGRPARALVRAARRHAGARLLPDDGRRRGRPRQRRRARVRGGPARVRARRSRTRSSGTRSASRSPSTRPCSSGSPTWPPRSRRPTR